MTISGGLIYWNRNEWEFTGHSKQTHQGEGEKDGYDEEYRDEEGAADEATETSRPASLEFVAMDVNIYDVPTNVGQNNVHTCVQRRRPC